MEGEREEWDEYQKIESDFLFTYIHPGFLLKYSTQSID